MPSDNRNWYDNIFKAGMRRASGEKEIAEGNPLDWERLRILKDGKLVPFMMKGHIGAPSEPDLDVLRAAAEQGNIFLYRMGEIYPQRWTDGRWYSTDPATREEKRPEPPKMPELNFGQMQAEEEARRARLLEEHSANVLAWQKRVKFYDNLSVEVKNALREEAPQRRIEIMENQEVQRAEALDTREVMAWYRNEFRKEMVIPSSDERFKDAEGIDWGRVRIWDGEQFARVVPEGHNGVPSAEKLQSVRDAAERGDLFMYQRGDQYPSKWTGGSWHSMDKSWIDSCKPKPLEELPKPALRVPEPDLESYMADVSQRKLAANKFFARIGINVYQSEVEKYERTMRNYQNQLKSHEQAKEAYERGLEEYNNAMEPLQNDYNTRLGAYESMLQSYEALTPQQRAAMEKDVQQRTEEIKRNKEAEQERANRLNEQVQNQIEQVDHAQRRVEILEPKPQPKEFFNGLAALGQDAYDVIAPNGYNLPENSRITLKDAAAIHIALAGSTQAAVKRGLSPMSADRYGQMLEGMLNGVPTTEELQYIAGSYHAAKEYIGAYAGGDPKPLGEAMGEGLRNLINVSRGHLMMSPEMAGLAKVAERIFKVLDQDQELLKSCGLSEEELKFTRGLAELGASYGNFLKAQVELTNSATGAKKLSRKEMTGYAVDLTIGKAFEAHLKGEEPKEKEKLVNDLAAVNGGALNTVKKLYTNDLTIQNVTTSVEVQKETDLNKTATEVLKAVQESDLSKGKADEQVQQQVKNEVKQQLNSQKPLYQPPKSPAEIERENDLKLARELLAQKDGSLAEISLEDERVQQKLVDLQIAQMNLEMDGRGLQDNDAMIPITDPLVQKEAEELAAVRELLRQENLEKNYDGKAITDRLKRLRAVRAELSRENAELELTDPTVVAKVRQDIAREEEAARIMVEEGVQAADVYQRETGLRGLENSKTMWRTKAVQERLKELKESRAQMGAEFANLPLNNMQVIQFDYRRRGIDPLTKNNTIVDVDNLTQDQKTYYNEHVQVAKYLAEKMQGGVYNNAPYGSDVDKAVAELKDVRQKYERGVEDAVADLPLNDPKIIAMRELIRANGNQAGRNRWINADIETFANDMKGKRESEIKPMAAMRVQTFESVAYAGRARQPQQGPPA